MSDTTQSFSSDAEIERIGGGLLDRTLPGAEWTHAAHWAAAVWLIVRRSDLHAPRDMPGLIRAYNASLGNSNTDTAGYHETITQASLRAARHYVALAASDATLVEICHRVLASELGGPDWLQHYWSKPRLFSVEARRAWVEPDVAPLPYPRYPV
ncbi:MAG: hypothetical protein ABI740_06190 [Alphaproteobacteria bacterium]